MNADNTARPGVVCCSNRDDQLVLESKITAGVLRTEIEESFSNPGSKMDSAIGSQRCGDSQGRKEQETV